MSKEKVRTKIVLVSRSSLVQFISEFTAKHFVTNQMPEGSANACILWCVKYALAREKVKRLESKLTDFWEDLPPLRMRRIDTQMHYFDEKTEYSLYLDLETDYQISKILSAKGDYVQKNGKTTKYALYPKFRNLKRNVIINCIKIVMADICTYTLYGTKEFTLENLMKYFDVEVSENDK